jgi:hypothetical protein
MTSPFDVDAKGVRPELPLWLAVTFRRMASPSNRLLEISTR